MAKQQISELIKNVKSRSRMNDTVTTAIPELHLSWYTAPTELTALVYEPCLCLIAQGAKEVLLAGVSYRMDPSQFLLVSVDLPVDARVIQATPDKPYLGLRIALDPKVVGEMLADGSSVSAPGPVDRGLSVNTVQSRLLDAVLRLVRLLENPEDIRPLAPLVLREIIHRLLTGPQGAKLRQMAMAGAPAYRIAGALRWFKENYDQPIKIETLAERAGMGLSSFHLHFKNVTAMTPLQYQKRLRLQEARHLMIGEKLDAAEAAFRVGYESPSQFSREYRREFGASPKQDITTVMDGGVNGHGG